MTSSPSRARSTSTRAARRVSLLLLAAALLGIGFAAVPAVSAAARKLTAANWNMAQQRLVVTAGLMSETPGSGFGGAGALTPAAERQALGALSSQRELQPLAVQSSATITVVRFDSLLVEQLGLGDVAAHVQQVARAAGLAPPSYFGSEVLARYLGLRSNHPGGEDSLELYPWSTITRAEAAHSFAVVLQAGAWAAEAARQTFEGFALPRYSTAQLKVLRIAVSKIGMPYVWGGTTDDTADGLEHGGYDCSGFAWRVYKLSGLSWGAGILGRTAAEQAGEIAKSSRVRLPEVQPGDLLFFGSARYGSRATEAGVTHEGLALSGEWAIHSSSQGVYVLPLTSGWLSQSFAWARRVV